MSENPFVQRAFRAAPERARRFAQLASQHLPRGPALRILDVGCGSGEELAHLVELVPDSLGSGVDISGSNILHAAATSGSSSVGPRLQFHAADYLDFETSPFDAIISDSTLQNIPVPDDRLYRKLTKDLQAGGVLICSIPYGCLYNHLLWTIRRCLRLFRGRATDQLILALGKRMTGGRMPADLLLERVHYMYLIPHRIGGAKLDALLADRYGLERTAEVPLPWASLAQPKHRLYVYRKAETTS